MPDKSAQHLPRAKEGEDLEHVFIDVPGREVGTPGPHSVNCAGDIGYGVYPAATDPANPHPIPEQPEPGNPLPERKADQEHRQGVQRTHSGAHATRPMSTRDSGLTTTHTTKQD